MPSTHRSGSGGPHARSALGAAWRSAAARARTPAVSVSHVSCGTGAASVGSATSRARIIQSPDSSHSTVEPSLHSLRHFESQVTSLDCQAFVQVTVRSPTNEEFALTLGSSQYILHQGWKRCRHRRASARPRTHSAAGRSRRSTAPASDPPIVRSQRLIPASPWPRRFVREHGFGAPHAPLVRRRSFWTVTLQVPELSPRHGRDHSRFGHAHRSARLARVERGRASRRRREGAWRGPARCASRSWPAWPSAGA